VRGTGGCSPLPRRRALLSRRLEARRIPGIGGKSAIHDDEAVAKDVALLPADEEDDIPLTEDIDLVDLGVRVQQMMTGKELYNRCSLR
jgi:hypothetical protein